MQGRVLARNCSSATMHGLGTLLPILGGDEHFLVLPSHQRCWQPRGLLQRIAEELKARVLSSRPGLVPAAELARLWLALPQGRLHAASCSPSSNTNSALGSSCQTPRLASTGKHQALLLPKATCCH